MPNSPVAVTPEAVGQARADQAGKDALSGTQPPQVVEVPEFLKGQVDETEFAKLPANQRTQLVDYGKRLYGDYTRKTQEVAELRRLQEDLVADPSKAEFLRKAVTEYEARKAGLLPAKSEKTEAVKTRLDALLEEATPDQREAVKALIEGLDERYKSDVEGAKKELGELKQTLASLQSDRTLTRKESLEQELTALPDAYKALGQRYRETILRLGVQPSGQRMAAEKLLQLVSTPEEYRQAVVASLPTEMRKQVERAKQTATVKPTGAVSTPEAFGEADQTVSRDKRYGKRWALDRIVGKMIGDIRRGMPEGP